MSGWSSPRSASPRTAPSVRNVASTAPRKRIANIARPSTVAPASVVAARRRTRCRRTPLDVLEQLGRAPRVEREEDDAQHEHDDEDAAAQRLAQRVGGDDASRDRLDVDVLERRAQHAHLEDLLAGGDEVGDDPRRVLAPGALEEPRPGRGLDLDAARARELARARPRRRRGRGRRSPRGRRRARPRESRCEFSSTDWPRRRSSTSSSRTMRRPTGSSALVGSSSSSSGGRPTSACAMPEPLLHALRHRLDAPVARVGQADELEQLGRARPRRRPSRSSRWCSSSTSSARAQPGKRNSSAR